MSEFEKESLSALLDNEADDLEIRRVLKYCEQDPTLLETWERFSLVQALLHEPAVPVSANLAQAISAQIANPPLVVSAQSVRPSSIWQQNFTKLALAASVALVFIVAVQYSLDDGPMPVAQEATELENTVLSAQLQDPALLAESATIELDPAAQQRLHDYLGNWTIDETEPVRMEHIQDSPLFRLVNELVTKPTQ